jgi:hypothetical protein
MTSPYFMPREDTPSCFDSRDQYDLWREMARILPPAPGHSYCEDCTSKYQSEMIVAGRCQYPGTIFQKTEEGELYGQRGVEIIRLMKSRAYR